MRDAGSLPEFGEGLAGGRKDDEVVNVTDLKALIPKLAGVRIIVVGDVILDEYLTGRAMRMSREAPIPVLEFESRRLIGGGAANPSANIVTLGGAGAASRRGRRGWRG